MLKLQYIHGILIKRERERAREREREGGREREELSPIVLQKLKLRNTDVLECRVLTLTPGSYATSEDVIFPLLHRLFRFNKL